MFERVRLTRRELLRGAGAAALALSFRNLTFRTPAAQAGAAPSYTASDVVDYRSWEEALRDIADRSIDVLTKDGPEGITWDPGGANQHGCNAIGLYRTGFVLDTPVLTINQEVGDPALEGEYKVKTTKGEVTVTPVFELLRKRLKDYAPEAAAKITGTSAETIRDLARQIARAKAATYLTQSNFGRFYHGLEMERVQILVLTLCGHIGKKGSGITGFPYLGLAGVDALYQAPGDLPPKLGVAKLGAANALTMLKDKLAGHSVEMILNDLAREEHARGGLASSSLFFRKHGGLDSYASAKKYDPWLKRSPRGGSSCRKSARAPSSRWAATSCDACAATTSSSSVSCPSSTSWSRSTGA
jgi:hypothetical protein